MRIRNALLGILAIFFVIPAHGQEWIYTVRPGDTLWDLIEKYSVNLIYVPKLQALNNIENPKHILPGSTITIPVKWLKKQPAAVEVKSLFGKVMYKPLDLPITELLPEVLLKAGDEVITGDGGSVELIFADGAKIILRANSSLIFDTLSQYGDTGMVDTRARLQSGRVDTKIPTSIGSGSRFQINTPAATTSVRGTGYRISVNSEENITRTEVLEGSVAVSAQQITELIPDGYGTAVEIGAAPLPPKELLNSPDISDIPELIERQNSTFQWKAVPNAESYRVQISEVEGFNSLIKDIKTKSPSIKNLSFDEDGEYFVRVRGVDNLGLEGLDAQVVIAVNARPEPPLTLKPPPNKNLRISNPRFSWSKPVDVTSFRFQLATDVEFNKLLVNQELSNNVGFSLEEGLKPGGYFWRLASIDDIDNLGPYGETQTFSYTLPPSEPELQEPEIEEDGIRISWPQGSEDQTYQFQFSKDVDFTDMLIDKQVDTSSRILKGVHPGSYFIRVATIDNDGTTSPFSTVQEINIPPPDRLLPSILTPLVLLLLAL
jgi:hypothetical protein